MAFFEGEFLATRDFRVKIGRDYRSLRDEDPDNPLLREGGFDGCSFYFHGPIAEHTHDDYVDYQDRLKRALS